MTSAIEDWKEDLKFVLVAVRKLEFKATCNGAATLRAALTNAELALRSQVTPLMTSEEADDLRKISNLDPIRPIK